VAEIAFSAATGRTRIAHLYQKAPCRVLFPDPPGGDLMTAVVATTSGGVTGGDRLRLDLVAGDGASVLVTTQAAEKVYRSLGADCTIDIRIEADAGTWFEWLPQETILFNHSRLRRSTTVEAQSGARLMAGDILVFGRLAHGEVFDHGFLHDSWQVVTNGRLMWMDSLRLDGEVMTALGDPAGFGNAVSMATFVYVADDASSQLEAAREQLSDTRLHCGATCVNGVLIARFLSADAQILRAAFAEFWAVFRQRVRGLPARLPRIWNC
jgi:urease accessory protein